MKKGEDKIGEALMKVALGYQIAEVTEEYAEVDGELKLTKRKKTKKDVPPDLKAVQLILSADGNAEYGKWSDEELEAEKQRLLMQLQESKALEGADKQVKAVKTVKTVKAVKTEKTDEGSGEKKTRPKPRKRVVRKTK